MNTSKIIKAIVNARGQVTTAQTIKENYGIILKIEGAELPEVYQVDFCNSGDTRTITMVGNADGVLIPKQFIDTGKDIDAYLYYVGDGFGKTVYQFHIPNKYRPDRTNIAPTPEEQSTIDQLIGAMNTAVAQTAQDVIDADASAQSASADADRAEQARDDAQGYADTAYDNAVASANSAGMSQTYANNASVSATASAQSAQSAEQSAQTASAKADSITGLTATATTLPDGSSASASYDAQTGVMSFGIPKGKDGTNGDDGYSPSVTVTDITGGHRVAITDKTGEKTFDVMDGDDYVLTEQDKQDIADIAEADLTPTILNAFPTDTASGAIASFTDGADDLPLKSLVVDIDPVQDLSNGDPSPENICPISGWAGMQLSVNGTVIPISWQTEAGTVYGGRLDVLSGKLYVGYGICKVKDLSWSMYNTAFYATKSDILHGVTKVDVRCDRYRTALSASGLGSASSWPDKIIRGNASASSTVYIKDTAYASAAEFKTAQGEMDIVYPLATPIEIQLDAHALNSLYGTNNIFADTGDTAVGYRADTKLYIEKLTQPEEDDMVADSAITSGQFFMVGNSLYRALANIASGATITVGTNAQRVSLADALNLVNA